MIGAVAKDVSELALSKENKKIEKESVVANVPFEHGGINIFSSQVLHEGRHALLIKIHLYLQHA